MFSTKLYKYVTYLYLCCIIFLSMLAESTAPFLFSHTKIINFTSNLFVCNVEVQSLLYFTWLTNNFIQVVNVDIMRIYKENLQNITSIIHFAIYAIKVIVENMSLMQKYITNYKLNVNMFLTIMIQYHFLKFPFMYYKRQSMRNGGLIIFHSYQKGDNKITIGRILFLTYVSKVFLLTRSIMHFHIESDTCTGTTNACILVGKIPRKTKQIHHE